MGRGKIVLIIIVSVFSACSSIKVKNQYNHQYDFTKLTTYKILQGDDSRHFSQIKSAVNFQMAQKGYGINEKYYDFILNWRYEPNGLFIIEISDSKSGEVIWRGWSEKTVLNSEEEINKSVGEILKLFPPQS